MIKRIKEKRMVEQEVEIQGECICDVCKKKIYEFDISAVTAKRENVNYKTICYWEVATYDSTEDSYETNHACSMECLCSLMYDFAQESNEYDYLRPHMEIETIYTGIPEVVNKENKL